MDDHQEVLNLKLAIFDLVLFDSFTQQHHSMLKCTRPPTLLGFFLLHKRSRIHYNYTPFHYLTKEHSQSSWLPAAPWISQTSHLSSSSGIPNHSLVTRSPLTPSVTCPMPYSPPQLPPHLLKLPLISHVTFLSSSSLEVYHTTQVWPSFIIFGCQPDLIFIWFNPSPCLRTSLPI